MFRYCKDDSKTHSFAGQLADKEVDTSTPALPTPEAGESPLQKKRQKHEIHIFNKEHSTKLLQPDDPDDGGASMV